MMKMMKNNYITKEFSSEIQQNYTRSFDCENTALTLFIKSKEAFDTSYGKTFVMLNEDKLIGYYNISTGHIENDKFYRIGGSLYINCFAVDRQFQRKIVGNDAYFSDLLLADCIQRASDLREKFVGFSFITLSSTSEGLRLYERTGFMSIEEDMVIAKNPGEKTCTPMYFPLDYE